MRFNINFKRITKQRMLPMDYQYYISAWIYKVLKQSDARYAHFLHEEGHGENPKCLYKLFCFGRLNFGKPILWKEQGLFEISTEFINLNVSFDVETAASNFIKGLFIEQEFYLGSRFNGIDFKVIGIENIPEPDFSTTEHYKTVTPWVISIKEENKPYATFISPAHPAYKEQAINHLVNKFNFTQNSEKINFDDIDLQISSDFKRSGYLIKPGTKQESRIVGNLCDFTLTAPKAIHKMIWSTGVCERSSNGFGWVEREKKGSAKA